MYQNVTSIPCVTCVFDSPHSPPNPPFIRDSIIREGYHLSFTGLQRMCRLYIVQLRDIDVACESVGIKAGAVCGVCEHHLAVWCRRDIIVMLLCIFVGWEVVAVLGDMRVVWLGTVPRLSHRYYHHLCSGCMRIWLNLGMGDRFLFFSRVACRFFFALERLRGNLGRLIEQKCWICYIFTASFW